LASAGRISSEAGREAKNLPLLRPALGQKLQSIQRWVLSSADDPDPFGHGITQLVFENAQLVIAPGPNEDHIVIDRAPIDEDGAGPSALGQDRLDPEYWRRVDLENIGKWSRFIDQALIYVDCFSDGRDDVALVFYFEAGDRFSIVLSNTDLVVAEGLEPFQDDLEDVVPRFRQRIGA